MEPKNDCQSDRIKEAFDNLYSRVMPYIDLNEFANADMAFKELDKKVHSEIYILKKCLAESDRAVDAGLTRSEVLQERISDLESENNAKQHVIESFVAKVNDLEKKLNIERKHGEDLADVNCRLSSENVDLKDRLTLFENSRITWRSRAQHAEKEVEDLNKKISELEEELAQARNSTEPHLMEENDRLRKVVDGKEKEINSLKKKIHELEEENIHKRPWHGDVNAMTGARTWSEMLAETIEFQNKKIEELEAEKARLKEAYDIHERTIKRLKLLLGKEHKEKGNDTCSAEDLSYGHEFKFGDKVFVPWSDAPYMYVKTGLMYNPRTERLVYVGKDQHLKRFGERFEIK